MTLSTVCERAKANALSYSSRGYVTRRNGVVSMLGSVARASLKSRAELPTDPISERS